MAKHNHYFAWLPNGNSAFGPAHHVKDENVFSYKIRHAEGDFAFLDVEIIDPNVGLLSAGREQWVWFSYADPAGVVTPLFHGRLIGIPDNLEESVITLTFIARPADFVAQKAALAESLKVTPYYDPIWVDEDKHDDPDTVLEGYSARWHIGRTDKLVTISDILVGEAGTVMIDTDNILHETFDISKEAPPIQKINVEATVSWDQSARGIVDFTRLICQAFGHSHRIFSYSGQGLVDDWPKYGDDIGAGWTAFDTRVEILTDPEDPDFATAPIDPTKATPDFEIEDWWETSDEGYDYWYQKAYQKWLAEQMLDPTRELRVNLWELKPTFTALYQGSRGRKEILRFSVSADMQALLAEPEEEAITEDFKVSSDLVGQPIDPDDARPIGSLTRNTYFGGDRGKESIAALLSMVRAKILASARAVTVTFSIPFSIAKDLSCRHDALVTNPQLPGGEAGGKIIAYEFGLNGDTGEHFGTVTIGCSIGKGNTLAAPDEGEATYVEADYVDDYQVYAGQSIQPIAGEITYEHFVVDPADDGMDFDRLSPSNALLGISATALLSFSGAGADGDTVTVGARTYTLKNVLGAANQVLIGATGILTAAALADAINRNEDTEGLLFGTGTVAHGLVEAEAADGIVRVTAHNEGVAGNAIAVSESSGAASWGTATLTGGHDGLNVYFPPSQQEPLIENPVEKFGSTAEVFEYLKTIFTEIELSLKPVTGGPFETAIDMVASDLMVPKTIDLEAV